MRSKLWLLGVLVIGLAGCDLIDALKGEEGTQEVNNMPASTLIVTDIPPEYEGYPARINNRRSGISISSPRDHSVFVKDNRLVFTMYLVEEGVTTVDEYGTPTTELILEKPYTGNNTYEQLRLTIYNTSPYGEGYVGVRTVHAFHVKFTNGSVVMSFEEFN